MCKLNINILQIRFMLRNIIGFCILTLGWSCLSAPTEVVEEENVVIGPPEEDALPKYQFDLAYVTGQFEPVGHPDFIEIDSVHANRSGMYLRRDAYTAFVRMFDAAKADGIQLQIRSATRNFAYQKGIWERKWTGQTRIENGKDASAAYPDSVQRALMILRYSSMPGSSRHHWGTDIDLNSFENSWFEKGPGLELYTWMKENGHRFGYCQPYTEKGVQRPNGYEEERWHWSYLPVAIPLTQLAKDSLKNDMISGFSGSTSAGQIDVVGNYVLGIESGCMVH